MILVINDLHLSEKPPGVRTPEYFRQICYKMLECAKIAAEDCDRVIITGDLFHHKVARNVSHRTVRVLMALLKRFRAAYGILGNHDILGAETGTTERQPVGTVIESGFLKLMERTVLDDVELFPINYNEKFEQGKVIYRLPEKRASKRILFMHSMLSPGSNLRNNIKGDFDLVLYGHPHWPDGFDGKFCNHGAVSRVRAEQWDRREVAVTLVNEKLEPYRTVLHSQKPWDEVFMAASEEKDAEYGEEFLDAFVQALEIESIDVNQDINDIIGELMPEVKTRLQYYLGSI